MVFAFYGISSMVDYCHPISNVTKYHYKSPHIYTITRNIYILQYIHIFICLSKETAIPSKKVFEIYIPIYTLCFLSLTIFPKRHRCAFWQVKRKETEKRYNTIYLSNAFSNIFWTFLPLHIWCSFHSKDRYGTLQTTFIDLWFQLKC